MGTDLIVDMLLALDLNEIDVARNRWEKIQTIPELKTWADNFRPLAAERGL